jgi:hypothetical protein
MRKTGKLVWVKNGDYQRIFKYPHIFLYIMQASPYRKLYNGLKTVTQAEVYL